MKVVRVRSVGGPEVLRLEEELVPQPAPGEVLVQMAVVGLNFIDIQFRSGRYPHTLPFISGMEGAGVVSEVGAGVSGIGPGARVAFAMHDGTCSEFLTIPADRVVEVPDAVGLDVAAAAMLQGLTVHYLTSTTFRVREGDRVLIHAAAGGVGRLLVQRCKALGAFVYGVVSSREKARIAGDAGADVVILSSEADISAIVRRDHSDGVAVAYDSVGRDTFEDSLKSLAFGGTFVGFGSSSGSIPPVHVDSLGEHAPYLVFPGLYAHIRTREALCQRSADLFGWLADGSLSLHVSERYPLSDIQIGHAHLEQRKTAGKVLIEM